MFDALCIAHLLPRPVAEHKFLTDRKFRFDWCWPETPITSAPNWRLAIEVEGGAWVGGRHTRGKGFVNDILKYQLALRNRWIVYRVTPDMLMGQSTINTVRELLA